MTRECERYGLNPARVEATLSGDDPLEREKPRRHWWESLVVLAAVAVFVWLGMAAERQPLKMDPIWTTLLITATLLCLVVGGLLLWKRTRFS